MSFEDLKKYQKDVVHLLNNSFQKDRLAPLYLFYGNRGTFKKEAARYLASLILCEISGACGQCSQCQMVANGTNPNLITIKPDGDSIKKDQILDLQEEFSLTSEGKRVFIIQDIDKATPQSANSLLKFLEELSEDCYGVLITESINRVLSTIRSRCQLVHFMPINHNIIRQDLQDMGIDEELSHIIAMLTTNVNDAKKMSNDSIIQRMASLAKDIGLSFETGEHNSLLIMNTTGRFLLDETSKVYHNYFFEMLVAFQNDKIKYLLDEDAKSDGLVFSETLAKNSLSLTANVEIQILEKILEEKERLVYNLNKELLYTKLFIEIKRCCH